MRVPTFSAILLLFGSTAAAADYPKPVEGDAVLKDFRFTTKETMDVKIHYLTIGKPERDKVGNICNAILILHATTGSTAQFVGKSSPMTCN